MSTPFLFNIDFMIQKKDYLNAKKIVSSYEEQLEAQKKR